MHSNYILASVAIFFAANVAAHKSKNEAPGPPAPVKLCVGQNCDKEGEDMVAIAGRLGVAPASAEGSADAETIIVPA
jgi:hypothetical protein